MSGDSTDKGREMGCNTQKSFSEEELLHVRVEGSGFLAGIEIRYTDVFRHPHTTREFFLVTGTGAGRIVSVVPGGSIAT